MPRNFKLRILNPLKAKIFNKYNLLGFDTETLQIPKKGDFEIIEQSFLLGCVYGNNILKSFRDKEEMGDFLTSRKLRSFRNFACNLDFDFRMIFQDSKKMKNMFMIERNGLIYAKYSPNYDNETGMYAKDGKQRKIDFLDIWNFTGKMSVEKIGDFLNIPKIKKPEFLGQKPKTLSEWRELTDYCIRDAEITYNMAIFLQNFCNELNCRFKITLASLGMDFWRRNYQKISLFQEKRFMLEKQYEAFHGGRVEMVKMGYFNIPIYMYDFNSHYPSCCHDGIDNKGSYPNPSSHHYIKKGSIDYIEQFEGISRVKLKIPYSYITPLGILSKEQKIIYPYGVIENFYTHVEIRKAISLGAELLEIGECIYYTENFIPFRECIKFLYKERKKYKEENNSLMSQMLKTLMNGGIFGKFAQKIDEKDNIIYDENVFCNEIGELFYIKDGRQHIMKKFIQRGKIFYEKIKNPKIPLFVHPILASYTTAIARNKLFDYVSGYPEYILYYDTDSLFMSKKCFAHSLELGELNLERIVPEMMLIQPKLYYYIDKNGDFNLKSKGLPKEIKSKDSLLKCMNEGVLKTTKWLRFKESEVRKEKYASIVPYIKKIRSNDTKRIWERPFSTKSSIDSTPICMTENI